MFVNTVPVRFNFLENISFDNYLKNVSQNIIGILRHQKYSYNSILEDIRSKFNNIPNLYNIMFSYQLTKAYDKTLGNYKTNWSFNNCIANDLAIHIYDINDTGEMEINYDYLINKYSEQDISDLHKRILHIISQIVDNPTINLNNIDIVTPEEKNKILYEFNNTYTEYPKNKTIINLFEEQVEKNPDNIAVVFEGQKLTYKELNEKANSLANYLLSYNIKSNDVIAILLNRSLDLIITIWAVIKSGAIYTLIDTNLPKEHIKYILDNSETSYCIINNQLPESITIDKAVTINVDQIIFDNFTYSVNKTSVEPISKLCIIYTSGSTGRPKGVFLYNHGFVNLVYGFDKEMHISQYRNILGISTVSFDMFAVELFSSLLFGNTLILANEEEQKNPNEMSKLIKQYNVDFFVTTPTRINLLLTSGNSDSLKNVKAFQLGGEKFTKSLYLKLKNYTNAYIYNGYGPTEITACCTNKLINYDEINIGKPIPNVQVYICNSSIKLLPIGVTGEICVAGLGVATGYLKNPIETQKRFIKNPFGPGYLYKTGDYGKYKKNGDIEYIGRIDSQIKIRGLRIELEGIEEQILKIPSIESCVIIKKEQKNREFLCAYFTSNEKINISTIRQHLKSRIPEYMIPQYFTQLERLPYTNSGKIDRKKLPDINITHTSDLVNPRNETDKKLIDLLKELLNINELSINDSFFEIGGDSLTAINLCLKIQHTFNVNILVTEILAHPIIKDLSDIIINSSAKTNNISITQVPKSDYYPISSAQKRIYFASNLSGNNSVLYNTPGGIIFDNELNLEKLEKCINILISRQESLRTYFEIKNKNVVQKIKNNIDFKLNVLENADFKKIDSIFNNFVKPFDLSKAPLFRINYLKFTNGKNAIFIDIHHIIFDGTSLSIFIEELINLYNNNSLPNLKLTYKDYSSYEFKNINTENLTRAKKYWIDQFKDGIPVLNMPTNFPRPSIQSFIGKKIYSSIDIETSKKIFQLCSLLDITPYMFLLSCYYILLSKYTSQNDIVIGSPIINRDLPETYNIIGMFVNTLALRNKINPSDSFKDFVLAVKNNLLNAFEYQTYPFDELVKDLNISRDSSKNPLFDTMFIFQNNGYKEIYIEGKKAEYYIPDTSISKFDLSIEAFPQNDTINLTFEYATSLFTENFIKNMSNHYLNTINAVLNNFDIQIKKIDILSPEEKHTILYDFNNTTTEYPKDKTIIDLFEEQVKKTPDNIAIVFEDQKLTYKELNEKANSLAYYLKYNIGIRHNDIIGVMTSRSLEVIISMLAILKAGGAYIPIDPSYPQERINYMLINSNASVLLTQNKLLNKIKFKNIVSIDLTNNKIYTLPNINLNRSNTLDDLMYVIYTSGSTGTPKGVMITHKVFYNFTNYCNTYVKYLKKPINHTIVSITTISFDIFAYETLISLQKGLKVILTNEDEQTSPNLLNKLMEKYHVDIIQSTPSIMQIFINNINEIPALKKIKFAILAGEQLPLSLVKSLHNLSDMIIYNGYGPSETYYCTLTEVNNEIVTIGKPINNSQIYILDDNYNPTPIGVVGEIYISGDCVGKGYLNNDSLTKKSFINNPFLTNLTMYKSGDLGKYLEDGSILCLGRLDHQIKIRGLRIELQEIETIMMKHPNIIKAAVTKQTVQNREFISAYYVAKKRISIPELRKYLSCFLPRYMIPSYFTVLNDLPYTPNGKIDKKQLPIPYELLNTSKIKYEPPKTNLQKQLVDIFQKILNTRPIGIYDNFFELGGDSLLAMNLNMELSKFTSTITYQDIFRFPTISELEQIINSNNTDSLYSKIENLPEDILNVLSNTKNKELIKKNFKRNILLTGSTGFLGIHILEELLYLDDIKIYCLIRPETALTPENKLKQKMNYYFGNKYTHLINRKIFIVEGDICKPNFGLSQEILLDLINNVDVIINSAANVSHFGNYENFYKTNVLSIKYMIDFCKNYNKSLYHISTIGIAGISLDKSYLTSKKKNNIFFDESSLYIGQESETVYSYSKFQAEILLLDAISNGLDAYILRMGNLMPRYRDGKFQENISDNAFINRIVSFIKIGIIPDYLTSYQLEFTPVDYAAKAICKILTHYTKTNRIFHLYNHKTVSFHRSLKVLQKLGYKIDVLKEQDFISKINQILKNDYSKNLITYISNDFDINNHFKYLPDMTIKSNFSKKYLRRTFFSWPNISNKYLFNFFNILKEVM